jgi:acyl carrier protein
MSDTKDKIITIIKNLIDLTEEIDETYKIGPDSDWDSLSLISLIVILEEELNIVLKLDFFLEEKSIDDICKMKK